MHAVPVWLYTYREQAHKRDDLEREIKKKEDKIYSADNEEKES